MFNDKNFWSWPKHFELRDIAEYEVRINVRATLINDENLACHIFIYKARSSRIPWAPVDTRVSAPDIATKLIQTKQY
jgi:hypothetical protein